MATSSIRPSKIARDYVKKLESKIKVEKAILFGSAATGKFSRHSDLDIIILSKDFGKMSFIKRLEFLSKARGREFLSTPMDILGYTPIEFKKLSKNSVILSQAKKEGKVL